MILNVLNQGNNTSSNDGNQGISPEIAEILKCAYEAVPIELKLKWTSQDDYEELKYILEKVLQYPSIDLAEIHRDSNRLGTLDLHENSQIITRYNFESEQQMAFVHCTCCGFMLQRDEVPFSTRLMDIDNIGISTFLYFETLKSLGIMLVIQLFIFGIFAIVTNIVASGKYQSHEQIPSALNFLVISLSSKQLNQTAQNQLYYLIQCWLGLVTVILWCFVLLLIKYTEKQKQNIIQSQTMSVADYSIMISGIPSKITLEQLQQNLTDFYHQLGENQKPEAIDKPLIIKKMNLAIPFYVNENTFKDEALQQLIQRQQKMKEEFIKWVIHKQQHNEYLVEPKEERRKLYHTYSSLKKKIRNKQQRSVRKVLEESKNNEKMAEEDKSSTVFITLESNHAKELICRLSDSSVIASLRRRLFCRENQKFIIVYNGEAIQPQIMKAPEPEDIIWTNLGRSNCEMVFRKLSTYTITLIILGGSFGIIYLLSAQQIKNNNEYFISFMISLAISVINVIIQQVIRLLTVLEREQTHTKHQTSLAIKSIFAQLINNIVTPFIVNYFIEERNLYRRNGLAYDLFLLGITNAFLLPLLKVFDFYYYFLLIRTWWYRKAQHRLGKTQAQLNLIFEYMPFEVGYQYIYPVNLYLFICFFISLQPIICIFGILGLLMMYWAQKYSVMNRTRRPFPGNDIVNIAMYQILYFGPLFFSVGNLTWSNLLSDGFPKSALVPNIISIAFGVLILFLPYKSIFIIFFEGVYPEFHKFQDKRIYLPSEYDRMNPLTSKEAIKQYIQYINNVRKQIKKYTTQQLQRLQKLFVMTAQQGHKKETQLSTMLKHYTRLQQKLEQYVALTEGSEQSMNENLEKDKPLDLQNYDENFVVYSLFPEKSHSVVRFTQNWKQSQKIGEGNRGNHEMTYKLFHELANKTNRATTEQQKAITYKLFNGPNKGNLSQLKNKGQNNQQTAQKLDNPDAINLINFHRLSSNLIEHNKTDHKPKTIKIRRTTSKNIKQQQQE